MVVSIDEAGDHHLIRAADLLVNLVFGSHVAVTANLNDLAVSLDNCPVSNYLCAGRSGYAGHNLLAPN